MEYKFQSFDFDKLIGVTSVCFNCLRLDPKCAGAAVVAWWTRNLSLLEVIYKIMCTIFVRVLCVHVGIVRLYCIVVLKIFILLSGSTNRQ